MIEALYFDFDIMMIGPDIGLQYQSPLTSILKSLISQNFNIKVFRLRYQSTSILKTVLYQSKLWYRSNSILKITSISWNSYTDIAVLHYNIEVSAISKQSYIEGYFDIEARIHTRILQLCTSISKFVLRYRRSISKLSLILSDLLMQVCWKRLQVAVW